MVGVIYPTYNRKEYVQMTLPALLYECKKSKTFSHLLIIDDCSTDGTWEYLKSINFDKYLSVTLMQRHLQSSWKQWNIANEYFDSKVKYLMKIDNDILVPLGITDHLVENIGKGFAIAPRYRGLNDGLYPSIDGVKLTSARHVGGVGLFSRKIFKQYGKVIGQNGDKKLYGFTRYQQRVAKKHPIYWNEKATVIRLDESPAFSMGVKYHEKGWQRMLDVNQNAPLNQ